jgi:hypothetical protein
MTVKRLWPKSMNNICLFLSVTLVFSFSACKDGQKNSANKSVINTSSPENSNEITTVSTDTTSTVKILADSLEKKLIGKWIRSDGGYTIEVFSANKDGKLDAGYFNPNPIHVDKAEWKISENILYMRVILKDINYPGSTYVLRYNPDNETLEGNYFQAVEKTNYDVIFTRKK